MRKLGWIVGLVLSALNAPSYAQPADGLLLTGADVVDVSRQRLLKGQAVLVLGDRIDQVGPVGDMAVPKSVTRIDLSGLTILPGLIDLHSHLLLHPYDEASWNDQVLRESLGLRTVRAVAHARATLDAGFTTLRDLGTEGAGFADVALRDAIKLGIVPGPRVFAATRAIVATGCYGPSGYDPRWKMPKGAQEADGVAGVRRAVREQIAAGADWIKVYADYRRRPGDVSTPTFSQAELNAIVDEARSAGIPVAAHASTNEAIRRAVTAGVATIEHGYDASLDVLILMHERGVVLCPTLTASESMARYGGWNASKPDDPRITKAKALMARALKAGTPIACGSDVGVFRHGDNVREIELMVDYGMTPADALASATWKAAKVLGRSGDLGLIASGFLADLVVVRGNPLTDVGVLRHPVIVIKNGTLVADRR